MSHSTGSGANAGDETSSLAFLPGLQIVIWRGATLATVLKPVKYFSIFKYIFYF